MTLAIQHTLQVVLDHQSSQKHDHGLDHEENIPCKSQSRHRLGNGTWGPQWDSSDNHHIYRKCQVMTVKEECALLVSGVNSRNKFHF